VNDVDLQRPDEGQFDNPSSIGGAKIGIYIKAKQEIGGRS